MALLRDAGKTSDAQEARERDRLYLLLEISRHVVSKLDATALFGAVAQSLRRYFGNDVLAFLILDNETGRLEHRFVDCPGRGDLLEEAAMTPPPELLNEWWRIGRPVRYSPHGEDRSWAPREGDRAESILSAVSVPLVGPDGPLGLFNIARQQAQAFSDADLDLLEQIGTQISLALDHAFANERLRASRDALRLSEAYLAEAQRLSHTGSWAFDVSGNKYVYLSEECLRIFEVDTPGDLPRREAIARLIHPEDWPRVDDGFRKAVRDKIDTSSEFRIVLPGGRTRHILVFRHPVLNGAGEIVELVGTVVDITERKRAEEALRESENERTRAEAAAQEARAHLERMARLKTMGELAASIAHELSQPLAALTTSANAGLKWLAREPPNVGKARAALTRVVRDGTRAGEIVARIRGAVKWAPSIVQHVNMNDVVRDVLPLMVGELRQHKVDVSLALDAVVPDILGDGIQLQQVLLNIVKNAIDAMADVDERPRVVRITSAVTALDTNAAVVVRVTDTGPGVRLADAARLFEPFQTTKPNGLGMGLWISRLIVEAHKGRLTALASSGPGATFEIVLPAVDERGKPDGADG